MPFTATGIDSTATATSREAEQLRLRFFALVDGYGRNPPERALWRELIELALGSTEKWSVGSRKTVAAHTVHHVALGLYMRANETGIIEGFSVPLLATDCRLDERTIRAAMQVLNRLHVVRSTRASRRKPAAHRMNLGGLDWPAVRARADASAGQRPALSPGQRPGLKGYVRTGLDLFSDPSAPPTVQSAKPTAERRAERARRNDDLAWAACECGRAWPWTPETGGVCDRCGPYSGRKVFLRGFDGRHRIVAALGAGGRCEVCGQPRPDRHGRCPGPAGMVTL